jgi:hypothetical protein
MLWFVHSLSTHAVHGCTGVCVCVCVCVFVCVRAYVVRACVEKPQLRDAPVDIALIKGSTVSGNQEKVLVAISIGCGL